MGQAGVPEEADTWVKLMQRSGLNAFASGTTTIGMPLNTKQAHTVNTVNQHDLQLQAYRRQRDMQDEGIHS